jgi:hypothetical protein
MLNEDIREVVRKAEYKIIHYDNSFHGEVIKFNNVGIKGPLK